MALTFLDLPPELRDVVYSMCFAEYASCSHGGCFQADEVPTTTGSWCPAIESLQADPDGYGELGDVDNADDNEIAEMLQRMYATAATRRMEQAHYSDHPPDYGEGNPINLLHVNRTVRQGASEVFLRTMPINFRLPQVDIAAFTRRWRQADPEKQVRSIIVNWKPTHWEGEAPQNLLMNVTLRLLTRTFPKVTRVEVWFGRDDPTSYYHALKQHLPGFSQLKEVEINDGDPLRVQRLYDGYRKPWLPNVASITLSSRLLKSRVPSEVEEMDDWAEDGSSEW
ncbi:hypothetical protein LTR10_003605 [Elasticomyces elasticus]|nr:hypothetical protein LTR10_003605 [Elasticomyces elasticus]KAK4978201.1 hypothetical protein LTR42_002579 [Elasticomyces elasticus]